MNVQPEVFRLEHRPVPFRAGTFRSRGRATCELWCEGCDVCVRYGDGDGARHERRNSFASAAAAREACRSQMLRLLDRGYRLGHESVPHLERIRANRNDGQAHAAYAAWLTKRGDPRGAFLAQMADVTAARPGTSAVWSSLRGVHDHAFPGTAAEFTACTWLGGFVDQLVVLDPCASLPRFLRHPSVILTRGVVIDLPSRDPKETIDALIAHAPVSVELLEFRVPEWREASVKAAIRAARERLRRSLQNLRSCRMVPRSATDDADARPNPVVPSLPAARRARPWWRRWFSR